MLIIPGKHLSCILQFSSSDLGVYAFCDCVFSQASGAMRYDRYQPYQYSYDINILYKLNIDIFKISLKINVDFFNNKNLSILLTPTLLKSVCGPQYCKINM